MSNSDAGYNGWTNYETRLFALWLARFNALKSVHPITR